MVLLTKIVKPEFDTNKGDWQIVSVAYRLDPIAFVPGDVTCFVIYEMHVKIFSVPAPPPPPHFPSPHPPSAPLVGTGSA